jgi:cation-transporting ATPase 13A3/4/5
MTRAEAESELDFIGFIIFENKLKPSTAGVLKELKMSSIGQVMVTGDNILTAISVARECGLIERNAHCFVPRFLQGKLVFHLEKYINPKRTGDSRDPLAQLQWESIDNNRYCLDAKTLMVSALSLLRDGDPS